MSSSDSSSPKNGVAQESNGNRFVKKLKDYKEIIVLLLFFIGGIMWMWAYFATERQLQALTSYTTLYVTMLENRLQADIYRQDIDDLTATISRLSSLSPCDSNCQNDIERHQRKVKQLAKLVEQLEEEARKTQAKIMKYIKEVLPIKKTMGN